MAHPVLFEAYPKLKENIPWVPLGDFPTPVHKLEKLGKEVGAETLYIKRDDLSSTIYGGNKVRKLEFVLAQAQQKKADTLITIGAAGTNHGLATTIHGHRLGMKSILILLDQPVAEYAKKNLLLDHLHNAKLVKTSMLRIVFTVLWQYLINMKPLQRRLPRYIPPGGSTPLGCLGYVNAAFELKAQVAEGLIPEPDYLFVALGTMGTGAGLHLGCRLADLKTRVIGIRVTERWMCSPQKWAALINNTNRYLRENDPEIPRIEVLPAELTFLDDYSGERYAQFTAEGMVAVSLMSSLEKIRLEGTYTGKALAGALDYMRKNHLQDKVLLFWNTHNSVDLSHLVKDMDYRQLPKSLHSYFESPNQELDRTDEVGRRDRATRPPLAYGELQWFSTRNSRFAAARKLKRGKNGNKVYTNCRI